jgi:hypothetical protein
MAAAAYKRYAQDAKEVIEEQLERNLSPKKLRRYLELTGPCLLVITYVEDALRCAPVLSRRRPARSVAARRRDSRRATTRLKRTSVACCARSAPVRA